MSTFYEILNKKFEKGFRLIDGQELNQITAILNQSLLNVYIFTGPGNYSMGQFDSGIIVNKASGSATQITLPANPVVGRQVYIKDGAGDAATNNITIVPPAASILIDNAASLVISQNLFSYRLIFNGTGWNVI